MSKRKPKTEIDSLRELLLEKREELNSRVEQRRQEIVADQEPEDEVAVALRNSSAGLAIANSGQYGICGVCGEKIPMARLKAIPWTRSCVECAGGRIVRSTAA